VYRVVVAPAAMADVDHLENWLLARGAPYRELFVPFHSNQYVIQYRVCGDRITIARIRHSLERR
jgi:plasmid stabilization system protein ParE